MEQPAVTAAEVENEVGLDELLLAPSAKRFPAKDQASDVQKTEIHDRNLLDGILRLSCDVLGRAVPREGLGIRCLRHRNAKQDACLNHGAAAGARCMDAAHEHLVVRLLSSHFEGSS